MSEVKMPVAVTSCVQLCNYQVFDHEQLLLDTKAQSNDDYFNRLYAYTGLQYPKFYKMDNASKGALLAASILLKRKNIEEYLPYQRGLLFQNHSASLHSDLRYEERLKEFASPALFVYTLPNIAMGEVAICHQFKGENTFFVNDQFDPKQLVDYATTVFQDGLLDIAIIGYLECYEEPCDIFLCLIEKNKVPLFPAEEMLQRYLQRKQKV